MSTAIPAQSSGNLDRPDFDALLRRFNSDSKRSLEEFESLRRRLTKFFEWNNCFSASEDLANLTIDTVARKPSEFVIDDIVAYSYGVARNIRMEFKRRSTRELQLDNLPETHPSVQDLDFEKTLAAGIDLRRQVDCLNHCLKKLKSEDRSLVMEYYSTDDETHMAQRRELARTIGVSMNALWVRVNRIRDKLEKCVGSRLSKGKT
jgi:DNA-directed RNA polymerase specialized sigma24 family protein